MCVQTIKHTHATEYMKYVWPDPNRLSRCNDVKTSPEVWVVRALSQEN